MRGNLPRMLQNWIEEMSASVWYISINRGSDRGLTCLMCVMLKRKLSLWSLQLLAELRANRYHFSFSDLWVWGNDFEHHEEEEWRKVFLPCYATRSLLIWHSFILKIICFCKGDIFCYSLWEAAILSIPGKYSCECHTVALCLDGRSLGDLHQNQSLST